MMGPVAWLALQGITPVEGARLQDYLFGPWTIHASEVFVTSPLSFAFVNLKPVVPGMALEAGVCLTNQVLNKEEMPTPACFDSWSVQS